ncbi:MAG: metallophosphoesterase family protein [Candidatus Thorarchaeota archaeon]|jgi:Icc-related predicted phosphoesterase
MKILAVADVHSPRFYDEFKLDLSTYSEPDLFLMAGDMVNKGTAEEIVRVLDTVEDVLGVGFPIIGCFGNEEYTEIRKKLTKLVEGRMTFLDEQYSSIKSDGKMIGIVGTQGSLDKATTWQRRNIPGVKRVFERRAARASSLLKGLMKKVDHSILLMHYSPCLETCVGEETKAFAWLGSRKFYSVVEKHQPDLVIHGHVHNASKHEALIGRTLVRNVSFPAVESVTELDLWS